MGNLHGNWEYGMLTKLANASGVSNQMITHLLSRRREAKSQLAGKLEKACIELKINISKPDWMTAKTTDNKLFYGEPLDATQTDDKGN